MPTVFVRTATPGGTPTAMSTGRVSREPDPTAALMAPATMPMTSRISRERGSTRDDPSRRGASTAGRPRAAGCQRQAGGQRPARSGRQLLEHVLQHGCVVVVDVLRREQQHDRPRPGLFRPVQELLRSIPLRELVAVARGELLEGDVPAVEGLAQRIARGAVLVPLVVEEALLLDAARPEPVHEDAALPRGGAVIVQHIR